MLGQLKGSCLCEGDGMDLDEGLQADARNSRKASKSDTGATECLHHSLNTLHMGGRPQHLLAITYNGTEVTPLIQQKSSTCNYGYNLGVS